MTMLANVHEDRYPAAATEVDELDDPDLVAQVRRLTADGEYDSEIGRALELSLSRVKQLRRRHGIPAGSPTGRKRFLHDDSIAADIRVLASTGLTDRMVAARLNLDSAPQVTRIRKERNIAPGAAAGPDALTVHAEELRRLTEAGLSTHEISIQMGLSYRQLAVLRGEAEIVQPLRPSRGTRQPEDVLVRRIAPLAKLGYPGETIARQLQIPLATVTRLLAAAVAPA